MTDPERLLKNPPSRLSVLLLRAGVEEKPSAAVLRRTSRAVAGAALTGAAVKSAEAAAASGTATTALEGTLAASGVAAGAAGAGTAATPVSAMVGVAAVAKWLGIGAVGGAIAATSAHQILPPRAEPASSSAVSTAVLPNPTPSHAVRAAPPAPPRTFEAPVPGEPPMDASAITTPAERAPPPSPASAVPAPVRSTARTDGAVLAAEVLFVDAGRAALQRGAWAEALERLRNYEVTFPKQQLLTEVLFLRMEAFSRSGNDERARALAERILTRGVTGPQAARARAVLER